MEMKGEYTIPVPRAAVWAASRHVYAGYAQYRTRVQDREIRIFVLERAGG